MFAGDHACESGRSCWHDQHDCQVRVQALEAQDPGMRCTGENSQEHCSCSQGGLLTLAVACNDAASY